MEKIKEPHKMYPNELPPGAGVTQFLVNELDVLGNHFSQNNYVEIPWIVVSYFTSSGDNFAQAHILADALSQLLKIKDDAVRWKAPKSWEALYGKVNDRGLLNDMF